MKTIYHSTLLPRAGLVCSSSLRKTFFTNDRTRFSHRVRASQDIVSCTESGFPGQRQKLLQVDHRTERSGSLCCTFSFCQETVLLANALHTWPLALHGRAPRCRDAGCSSLSNGGSGDQGNSTGSSVGLLSLDVGQLPTLDA